MLRCGTEDDEWEGPSGPLEKEWGLGEMNGGRDGVCRGGIWHIWFAIGEDGGGGREGKGGKEQAKEKKAFSSVEIRGENLYLRGMKNECFREGERKMTSFQRSSKLYNLYCTMLSLEMFTF